MAIIKHGNNALSSVTAFPSAVPTGKPVLLSTATASSSASIEFTSGIDSTYDIYQFEFINCNPSTNSVYFKFNLSTDGGSTYAVTKTTTAFYAFHDEADTYTTLTYTTGNDLAQSTADQPITASGLGSGSDESVSGSMFLFSPSSSIYVKHFISDVNYYYTGGESGHNFVAGYGNTSNSIDAIKFVMSSGNFDGTIKMYGISA